QTQMYSTNGGATWGQTTLPLVGADVFHSDPAVDFTSDGVAWSLVISVVTPPPPPAPQTYELRVRAYHSQGTNYAQWVADTSSSDNQTHGTPSGTQITADKELMWIDHSATSPFRDTIYAIWHAGTPAFVSRRTPGAGGSWSAPLAVSGAETTGFSTGGDVKTNANGDVFAFWPSSGSRQIDVAKSTNGGAAFTALTTGAPTTPNVVTIANTVGSYQIGIPAFNGDPAQFQQRRRPAILPSGGAFRNGTRDLVYAAWMDLDRAGCTAPDTNTASTCKTRIWFSRSTDGGAHWANPVMLNNQPGLNDQFNPRLTVDEATGGLTVAYYDTALDTNRRQAHVFAQHSANDGVSWSAPVQVTDAASDETGGNLGIQYGDYSGISAQSGTVFPSWTDHRSGIEEIWTDRLTNNPAYQGYHDGQDCRTAWGWAWDQVVRDATRINVDVYDGATLLGSTPANLYRGDLQAAGIGDGQHAFNFNLPPSILDRAAHSIQVRFAGTNTALAASSRTCASLFTTQVAETYLAGSNYENASIFTSSSNGFIVALKYYRAPGETGTHVGNLWDDIGNRLATVTFSGESASGWQTQFLPSRVAISANTRYRVSYGLNSSLSKTNCGASAPTFTNGPISFVGSSYGTPNGSFPGTTSCGSYFFADVVFTQ
ncbi:MAG TPA: DUF4082 domain-containing protein, partial [Thermoanaerobaculia bacterium]|nr:DUF4082 domain-containing protein [Thermoanaerobaculia bacterium]